ncbi:hypothetical protein [Bradyrhizobium ganzhouense]|uniref:hypothetical protein n=1 Tax=Bradyrhizobium ganzhouense TaxID=1179767 RepID=UPI003CEEA787
MTTSFSPARQTSARKTGLRLTLHGKDIWMLINAIYLGSALKFRVRANLPTDFTAPKSA